MENIQSLYINLTKFLTKTFEQNNQLINLFFYQTTDICQNYNRISKSNLLS